MHICSVRVAASQCNIVFNGSREGSSSVNTHTGSVSVAGPQSNIVSEARSVSPGMNIMNMKNVAMRKYDDIVCLNGMCQKCVKCTNTDAKRPTCDMKYKKKKHTVAKPGPKSKECPNPPLSSTVRFVRKGGRGGNNTYKTKTT